MYLLHLSGIIGNGLLDVSDSAPLSATDVSMATLVPLMAATMDRLAVNATATMSSVGTGTFHPESPSTDLLMADSSSSSFPLDATPMPTADWLMSFSTISAVSSVEPTSTSSEPGKKGAWQRAHPGHIHEFSSEPYSCSSESVIYQAVQLQRSVYVRL